MKARLEVAACALILALAGCLYFSTAHRLAGVWFRRVPDGYYGLQTAGFRSGHLYAAIEPHPGLLALKNPYDPVANGPYRVHDMSLWQGKYYLYFGPTPILIFIWPIVAATGWYPTEPLAVAVFGLGGCIAGAALLVAFRRRFCPGAPSWVAPMGTLCLAFGSPIPVLMQNPQFYQVPIACAFFLLMLTLGALYRALAAPRFRIGWLAAASLLFGLTLGARPNYLPGGIALGAVWIYALVGAGGARARWPVLRFAGITAAAFGPAALCGCALLAFNWLRFGSPTEFGIRYVLAGSSQVDYAPFSLRNLWANGRTYLFAGASWSPYFPFFFPRANTAPALLRHVPWGWLAPAALLAGSLGGSGQTVGRAMMGWVTCLWAALNLAVLVNFTGINARYASDFAPAWILAGGMGALVVTERFAMATRWRRWIGTAVGLAGAVTAFTGLAAFVGLLPRDDQLVWLARPLNWPAYLWERASGANQGALRLELELPSGRVGASEPLFQTGRSGDQRDWLFIDYLAKDRARIGFFHAGLGELVSGELRIPPDRRITVETRCGSLLPPFAHPAFAGLTRDTYEAASRDLVVKADGAVCLHGVLSCYDSAPQDLLVGRLGWTSGSMGLRFTGRILGASRLPVTFDALPAVALQERRPVRLTLLFPADRLVGSEPLLATGQGDRSDLLRLDYEGWGRLRFGLDHFGMGGPRGEPLVYDPSQLHTVTVWMGSLAGPAAPPVAAVAVPWSSRLVVLLDGREALNVEQVFFNGSPETAVVGANAHGSTGVGRRFGGRVLAAEPTSFESMPALDPMGRYGSIGMSVMFPPSALGSREPLVVTGVSGAGDFVFVHYVDPTHVALGFDHWGIGGIAGPPLRIDYRTPHRIGIVMGSLFPAERGLTLVRVTVDGKVALEGRSPCHPSMPRQIRIGLNQIGGSSCAPAFTGRVLSIERSGEPPP